MTARRSLPATPRSRAAAAPFWRDPGFIGRTVHLLKNHATALRSASHLLLEAGPKVDEAARERWRATLRDSGARLVRLLDQLAQLAEGRDGVPVATADVPLAAWLTEQVRAARAAERTSRVRLTVTRAPAGAWRLPAGPAALALGALLRNALLHPPGGTRATVSADTRPGGLIFTVRDHGTGIPADEQRSLFTPFFRGEAARERPGAGLELALARAAIARAGGRMSHHPVAPRGARFEIYIPASRTRKKRVRRPFPAR